ncbi:hypothetical protein O1L60_30595 [Streptomyces diastatochromogenes]|nr:hypothetical protein [Streptomyces diastatochromogenes]
MAALAVLVVLAAAGGVVRFLGARSDDAGYGPSYPAADSYVPGGKEVELTLPDATYEFDLKSGKVVPADTAAWYMARDRSEFVLPEDSDAFVAPGEELTPADCVRGIDTEPATRIAFADLADERPFCVRSADGRDIVVVRLIEARSEGGPVTAAFERYHSER